MDPSIYNLRLRDVLTICVLGLLFLGIAMVQSAAMRVTGTPDFAWTETGRRHVIFAIVALAAYFTVGHIDYRRLVGTGWWRRPVLWMLGTAVFACLIVLIPHVGTAVNGARRWLPLGFTQVQPSELGKWGVVLFLAWWMTNPASQLDRFFRGFVPTLMPVGIICLLVVVEDFGTAALIGVAALLILLAGRARWWHLLIAVPPAVAAGVWFVMSEPYRWRRFTAFWDPFAAPQREGYHMIQSLLSFATGGLVGKGLGNGVQKLGYLPEDTTDFIFAVVCEELGLFGALLTVALYLGILYVVFQAIRQKIDSFGRLLAFGIGAMIGLQAMINIAVATVSVPTKGMSLPLVSAGGSGLVITCCALGLLHSICRIGEEPRTLPADDARDAAPAAQPL